LILHDFWRSSAAYRVRIALNIKDVDYRAVAHSLLKGEQRSEDFLALNPQGLVPALQIEQGVLAQSLAIIEYVDEVQPQPALLPAGAFERATVRAMALGVACDIHPLNNLRVLNYLRSEFKADDNAVNSWVRHWIVAGFVALEEQASRYSTNGEFCFAARVSIADVCLVPQMYNARRFGCDLSAYPTLVSIDAHCRGLDAFASALPESQADAPVS